MWWEGNDEWFNGKVAAFGGAEGEHAGLHHVQYDDGDDDVRPPPHAPPHAHATPRSMLLLAPVSAPQRPAPPRARLLPPLPPSPGRQWADLAEEFAKKTMDFVSADDPAEEDVPDAPADRLRAEEARGRGGRGEPRGTPRAQRARAHKRILHSTPLHSTPASPVSILSAPPPSGGGGGARPGAAAVRGARGQGFVPGGAGGPEGAHGARHAPTRHARALSGFYETAGVDTALHQPHQSSASFGFRLSSFVFHLSVFSPRRRQAHKLELEKLRKKLEIEREAYLKQRRAKKKASSAANVKGKALSEVRSRGHRASGTTGGQCCHNHCSQTTRSARSATLCLGHGAFLTEGQSSLKGTKKKRNDKF